VIGSSLTRLELGTSGRVPESVPIFLKNPGSATILSPAINQ